MPKVGGRYLLFLTSTHNNKDISILTGYQLTPDSAIPLDTLYQVPALPVLRRSIFSKEYGT